MNADSNGPSTAALVRQVVNRSTGRAQPGDGGQFLERLGHGRKRERFAKRGRIVDDFDINQMEETALISLSGMAQVRNGDVTDHGLAWEQRDQLASVGTLVIEVVGHEFGACAERRGSIHGDPL